MTTHTNDIAELIVSLKTIKRHPGVYLNGIKFQPIHSETLDKIEDALRAAFRAADLNHT